MPVRIHFGPVTEVEADAIINAANTELQHGGGVAAAIVRKGGRVIQEESDRIGWCDLGSAVATTAGALPARYVIHVPTIDYRHGRRATLTEVEGGTHAALELARQLGLRRVAFPLLGVGVVGLPGRPVATAMATAIRDFPDLEVTIAAYSPADREAIRGLGEG